MKTYKNNYSNLENYTLTDCGAFGKAFESALTGKRCKAQNKVDRWLGKTRLEVKTSAGELGNAGSRLLAHTDKVIYCPVPLANADGYVDPYVQEAFVLTREEFLQALAEAGALREKTSTAGVRKVTIQTFWNRKANKPHGVLLYRLLDALYEHCECTLEELLEG